MIIACGPTWKDKSLPVLFSKRSHQEYKVCSLGQGTVLLWKHFDKLLNLIFEETYLGLLLDLERRLVFSLCRDVR